MPTHHVAIVGGGISGLAAAYFLKTERPGLRVTVFESAPQLGGKLRTSEVGGVDVDEGADAILMRRPEGHDLVRDMGADDQLAPVGTSRALVWSRGTFRELPSGQVMGVPGDLGELARSRVLSSVGLARASLDLVLPASPVGDDVSVGRFVATRLGAEVVDRLVDPLLGGVYAGHAGLLSFEATVPLLFQEIRNGRSLIHAARSGAGDHSSDPGPLFSTLRGGLGTLPPALAKATRAAMRTSTTVRELRRSERGWRLTTGPTRDPEIVDADAVILATPAHATGRLLSREVPFATGDLEKIDYASVAIVTLVYQKAAHQDSHPDPGLHPEISGNIAGGPGVGSSGYLVPAVEGKQVKAVTFASSKWPHLALVAPGKVIVRCSIGRYGEEHTLQRPDTELVAAAAAEVKEATGTSGHPIDTRVTRWGGALPQYAVGHRSRVDRVRATVANHPGLALCGAAYDGLGIPACVASARKAATRVLEFLGKESDAEGARSE